MTSHLICARKSAPGDGNEADSGDGTTAVFDRTWLVRTAIKRSTNLQEVDLQSLNASRAKFQHGPVRSNSHGIAKFHTFCVSCSLQHAQIVCDANIMVDRNETTTNLSLCHSIFGIPVNLAPPFHIS